MYKYETHLHTSPVSRCATADVRSTLEFYKELGFDGVFITNHFLDGNINIDSDVSYEEKINFYFSDYEEGVKLSKDIGIKVFCGVEMSYDDTHFLVYGLDKDWYLRHPEIMDMKKTKELSYLIEHGALVVQAHPYRDASNMECIRLFPHYVHGVEVINASRSELENFMAKQYAVNYKFLEIAGSDNHCGNRQKLIAGICTDTPLADEMDFIERVKNGQTETFVMENPILP